MNSLLCGCINVINGIFSKVTDDTNNEQMYVYNTYVMWTIGFCQSHSPQWAAGIPTHTQCVVVSSGSGSNRSGLRPNHSSHALIASIKLMTAGLCSCGSTLSLGLLDVPPFCSLSSTFPSEVLGPIFCSLHFLSFYMLSPLCFQVRHRPCEYVHWPVLAGNTRAYFGQNQLTQESFYSRSSYKL